MIPSLGPHQLAECMRCGEKVLASSLQHDGRNPRLLVCSKQGCWDPAHPQERPFVTLDVEGKPRFPMAPEHIVNDAPVLSVTTAAAPVATWTRAGTIGPRVESYKLYRAAGTAGAFVLINTQNVTFAGAPRYTITHPSTRTDSTAAAATLYRYRVDAITDDGRAIASNVITVTTP